MKRHMRDNYYVVGEGILTRDHDHPGDVPGVTRGKLTRPLREWDDARDRRPRAGARTHPELATHGAGTVAHVR